MTNLQLFAGSVAIWSTTWLAITFQLGVVAPEMSVAYRFLAASLILFGWCAGRRLPLAFAPREHAWFALFGALTFSVSYLFVYYAEQRIVSGLVAVGYSASPLLGMLGMRLFFGAPMTARMAAASALGIGGVVLVFLPEVLAFRGEGESRAGAIYTALAVLVSALGAQVAHRNQQAKLPLWQTMAWGMLYGALLAAAIGAAQGERFAFEATPAYVGSLLYLALFGSVLAFGGYLTLLGRIGAARASYIGVMVPVVALFISAAFEGFRFHVLTWAGIGLSVAGNVLVFRPQR